MKKICLLVLTLVLVTGCGLTSTATFESATPSAIPRAQSAPTVDPPESPTRAPAAPTVEPSATAVPEPSATPTPNPPTPTPSLAPTEPPTATPVPAPPTIAYSFPIGLPGQPPGDGFFIRHGYAVENTWYNPGYWHTGEDWYALEGDTAGAQVYSIAAGEVVYVGANYPGRVVIVRHPDDLFSMYGHLDPAVAVQEGQAVARGARLGVVLRRSDNVPDHLHFEVRTFLTTTEVNGAAPRYDFRCGVQCPPGPGYWPFFAPELPDDLGWRNPTHVIMRRAFAPDAGGLLGEVVVASRPVSPSVTLWSAPPLPDTARQAVETLALQPGDRFSLLGVWAGPEAPQATSARAYELWYRIILPDGRDGWVQAAVASPFETGSDNRPASIRFNFFPAVTAAPAAQSHGPQTGL